MFFVSLFVCLVIFFGLVGWLVCSLDYFVWVGEGGGIILFLWYIPEYPIIRKELEREFANISLV